MAGSKRSIWRVRRAPAAAVVVVALIVGAAVSAYALNGSSNPDKVTAATARFHDVAAAEAAQYGRFVDTAGIACIAQPGVGAMGVHYVDQGLVGDGAIDPLQPEALVYAPRRDGSLQLAAVEYLVVQQQWDAAHDAPPALFGQTFMLTPAPNRFGLPAFYSLHAWLYKHNPAGEFEMWNPNVHCPPVSGAASDPSMAGMPGMG